MLFSHIAHVLVDCDSTLAEPCGVVAVDGDFVLDLGRLGEHDSFGFSHILWARVLYPTYANAPRVCNLTALSDQVAAGAGMWFFGSFVFLIAAMWVAYVLLGRADHLTKWTSLRMTAR